MSRAIVAVVFGVALGACLVGADAFTQYQKMKVNGQAFSATSYVDSITLRIEATKAERLAKAQAKAAADELAARRATPPTAFLPTAPEGWVRREWRDDDKMLLSGGNPDMSLMTEMHDIGLDLSNPFTIESKINGYLEKTQLVYEKGDAYVVLSAKVNAAPKGTNRQQAAMGLALANMKMMDAAQPFGAYAGVAWTQSIQIEKTDAPLRLKADLGGEVTLRATAQAPDPELRALLAAIDYDGLNGLLSQPLEHVSNDLPILPVEDQIAFAKAQLDGARARLVAERNSAQQDLENAFQLTGTEKMVVGAAQSVNGLLNGASPKADEEASLPTSFEVAENQTETDGGTSLVGGLMSMLGGSKAETIDVAEEAENVAEEQAGFAARLFGAGKAAADDKAGASSAEGKPVVVNRLVNQRQGSGCAGGTFCKAPGVED